MFVFSFTGIKTNYTGGIYMVEKITMQANCYNGFRSKVVFELESGFQFQMEKKEMLKVEKFLGHLKRNKRVYMTMAYVLALNTLPGGSVLAAGAGMSSGFNLIVLLQKAAFWVGLGITIWGIVEMQLDAPGWKGRIMKGILGYIAILLIPLVFLELDAGLRADVWDQINNKNSGLPVGGGNP
jgi:hypothetical protein